MEAFFSGDKPSRFFDETSNVEFNYICNQVHSVADILEQKAVEISQFVMFFSISVVVSMVATRVFKISFILILFTNYKLFSEEIFSFSFLFSSYYRKMVKILMTKIQTPCSH